jgi:hypothetical protein
MADDGELIEQPNGVNRPTHLVDMHSRTGFSGSPVFVFEYPNRVWIQDRPVLELAKPGSGREERLKLFGIHCGQYSDWVKVRAVKKRAEPPLWQGIGDVIKEGDEIKLPGSMNTVVPSWRITEMLDHPDLERLRQNRDDVRRDEHDRMPRPESIPPASDEKPDLPKGFQLSAGTGSEKEATS